MSNTINPIEIMRIIDRAAPKHGLMSTLRLVETTQNHLVFSAPTDAAATRISKEYGQPLLSIVRGRYPSISGIRIKPLIHEKPIRQPAQLSLGLVL